MSGFEMPVVDPERAARWAAEREIDDRKKRVVAVREWWARCARGTDGLGTLPRWPWARWSDAEWRGACTRAVLDAIQSWTPASGPMLILAPTGAGKSSSLVAWTHALADAAMAAARTGDAAAPTPADWRYVTGPDLAEATRRRRLGGDEHEFVSHAGMVAVLLLDELGTHTPSDVAFALLDRRQRAGLPTVTCSGLTRAELTRHFGAAGYRRMIEHGRLIDMSEAGR